MLIRTVMKHFFLTTFLLSVKTNDIIIYLIILLAEMYIILFIKTLSMSYTSYKHIIIKYCKIKNIYT